MEAKRNIQVMMEVILFGLPLEGPVTTVKRRGIEQINVLRRLGILMETAMQVETLKSGSVGRE
jgi:hypothetical protein